jgi:kumamolisin
MTEGSFVPLPGSEREALPDVHELGPVGESERIEVTLVTRRRAGLPAGLVTGPATITPEELASTYGTDPADVERVREVLAEFGLEVTSADPGSRQVKVAGTASALSQAFGATLRRVTSPGPGGAGHVEHRYREGRLRLPAALEGIVLAVLGLDNRPQARAHFRAAAAATTISYTPPQVADVYQFPAGTDGSGQTVAVIELGGGFAQSDLQAYFSGLGITTPSVTAASVDGATNVPGQDPNGADGEVLLDIEVIGAVAPGAAQVVYFAPNTDQGFIDAVTQAAHATPTPIAISISWGQSEDTWTAQSRTAFDQALSDAAALGVTVTAAAGDNGSTDGVNDGKNHCDFPASSPHVLACGGTRLEADPSTGAISSEVVWNETATGHGATGGGVSDVYPLPSWQASAGVPAASGSGGRGVPDVAGNADPETGYQVLVDGSRMSVGGTSAVAPLWAGLIARLAQSTGKKFGLLQPALYSGIAPGAEVPGFHDITSGNNGGYSAGPGWDPCTGLGSPSGTALLARLSS